MGNPGGARIGGVNPVGGGEGVGRGGATPNPAMQRRTPNQVNPGHGTDMPGVPGGM